LLMAKFPELMQWTALHRELRYIRRKARREDTITPVAIIGLDIAKTVFQVHGVDAAGQAVIRQRLTRGRVRAFFEKLAPCLVGMEDASHALFPEQPVAIADAIGTFARRVFGQ
jgi:hypothetical protein